MNREEHKSLIYELNKAMADSTVDEEPQELVRFDKGTNTLDLSTEVHKNCCDIYVPALEFLKISENTKTCVVVHQMNNDIQIGMTAAIYETDGLTPTGRFVLKEIVHIEIGDGKTGIMSNYRLLSLH